MFRSLSSAFFHQLLLTLSLLYLGYAGYTSFCDRITSGSKYQRARNDLSEICKAVEGYRKETGQFPVSLQALEAMNPLSIPLKDYWNADYQYRLIPALPAGYGVYSFGMDGLSDSEGNDPDDLNSWVAPEKAVNIDPYKPRTGQVAVAAFVLGFVLKGFMTRRPEAGNKP